MKKDYCNVCGDTENIKYSDSKRQYLCSGCFQDTPKKESFLMFAQHFSGMPYKIQKDFYEDYIASSFTLDTYINR